MPYLGPIVIVEDDADDQEIIIEVLEDLKVPNELIFFEKSNDALNFLKSTAKPPFIILCDINMSPLNGLDLKKKIDSDPELGQKNAPFIFFSTAATKSIVSEAYTKMIQGFFKKSSNMEELKHQLFIIMEYWRLCKYPNAEL